MATANADAAQRPKEIAHADLQDEKRSPGFHPEKRSFDRLQILLQLWKEKNRSSHATLHDNYLVGVASEVCSLLLQTNSFDALAIFLDRLPDKNVYRQDEIILRAKVHLALRQGDTTAVYRLIKDGSFVDGEDLIKVWDDALYMDEERRLGKPLTPLIRFRLRKRNPPPSSICPQGARRTNSLPREATSVLKSWLHCHAADPYPSALEKQELARLSGLSGGQVKTWFANARRRSKKVELRGASPPTTDHARSLCSNDPIEFQKSTSSNAFAFRPTGSTNEFLSGYESDTFSYMHGFFHDPESSLFHHPDHFHGSSQLQLHAHQPSAFHSRHLYPSLGCPFVASAHMGLFQHPSSSSGLFVESLACPSSLPSNFSSCDAMRLHRIPHCPSENVCLNAAKVLVNLSTGRGYFHPSIPSGHAVRPF
uniref:Sine oculis-like transcription factor n=1 Tax=Craspedacusta sowerbii TaxID=128124 RepID=G4XIJ7_CRASO|nr:sine oculis-like transcription factor [Craspedacusta sowerbii]